jgi:hypothetical protein
LHPDIAGGGGAAELGFMSIGKIMLIGLFVSMGGWLLVAAGRQLVRAVLLLRSGIRTTATVVGHETKEFWFEQTQTKARSFYPVIEFADRGGGKQRVTLQDGSTEIEYAESYPVRIIYQVNDPRGAMIDSSDELWVRGAITLALGLLLLSIAIVVWAGKL